MSDTMPIYHTIDFNEAGLLLHIVESAAKVQNLHSLSNAALSRLKEIDMECLEEAKAIAAAKIVEEQPADDPAPKVAPANSPRVERKL